MAAEESVDSIQSHTSTEAGFDRAKESLMDSGSRLVKQLFGCAMLTLNILGHIQKKAERSHTRIHHRQ